MYSTDGCDSVILATDVIHRNSGGTYDVISHSGAYPNHMAEDGPVEIASCDYVDSAKDTLSRLQELQNRAQEALAVAQQQDQFVVDLKERLSGFQDSTTAEQVRKCIEALNRFEGLRKCRLERQNEFIHMLEDVYSQKVTLLKQIAALRNEASTLFDNGGGNGNDLTSSEMPSHVPSINDNNNALREEDKPLTAKSGTNTTGSAFITESSRRVTPNVVGVGTDGTAAHILPFLSRRDSVRSLDSTVHTNIQHAMVQAPSAVEVSKAARLSSGMTGNKLAAAATDLPPMMMDLLPPAGGGNTRGSNSSTAAQSAAIMSGIGRYPKPVAASGRYSGDKISMSDVPPGNIMQPLSASGARQQMAKTGSGHRARSIHGQPPQLPAPIRPSGGRMNVGGGMNDQPESFVPGSMLGKEDDFGFAEVPQRGEALAFLYEN